MVNEQHYALINGRIYTGNDILDGYAVLIKGDKIEAVIPQHDLEPSVETIDIQGINISAGFIDLQLNSCGGVMLNNEITVETLQTMHDANLKSGCTNCSFNTHYIQ